MDNSVLNYWKDIDNGDAFMLFRNDVAIIYGCKLSSCRYFDYVTHAYKSFPFNMVPTDKCFFRAGYPNQLLKRQIDYLYYSAPEDLQKDFDKAFPNRIMIRGKDE